MNITDLIKKEMREGILKVMSGKAEEFESKYITCAMVQDYMLNDAKCDRYGDNEYNGTDIWMRFTRSNLIVYVAYFATWDGTFIFGKEV